MQIFEIWRVKTNVKQSDNGMSSRFMQHVNLTRTRCCRKNERSTTDTLLASSDTYKYSFTLRNTNNEFVVWNYKRIYGYKYFEIIKFSNVYLVSYVMFRTVINRDSRRSRRSMRAHLAPKERWRHVRRHFAIVIFSHYRKSENLLTWYDRIVQNL